MAKKFLFPESYITNKVKKNNRIDEVMSAQHFLILRWCTLNDWLNRASIALNRLAVHQ